MGQLAIRKENNQRNIHLIILAGGDGERLSPLTRSLYGRHIPKQFAEISAEGSLLEETVSRMLPLVPEERMTVVVPSSYASLARRQLARWPAMQLVEQPANRGTAPGLLLPLAAVLARAPDATVVVTASDHHVPHPAPFLKGIESAIDAVSMSGIALVGVRSDRPETDYGWILPGANLGHNVCQVLEFVEKPDREEAIRLHREGGLWNTMVMASRARTLWSSIATHMLAIANTIAGTWDDPEALAEAYEAMPNINFSKSVLTRDPDVTVVPVEGSGWSDWGTPERVLKSLRASGELPQLLGRFDDYHHVAFA